MWNKTVIQFCVCEACKMVMHMLASKHNLMGNLVQHSMMWIFFSVAMSTFGIFSVKCAIFISFLLLDSIKVTVRLQTLQTHPSTSPSSCYRKVKSTGKKSPFQNDEKSLSLIAVFNGFYFFHHSSGSSVP